MSRKRYSMDCIWLVLGLCACGDAGGSLMPPLAQAGTGAPPGAGTAAPAAAGQPAKPAAGSGGTGTTAAPAGRGGGGAAPAAGGGSGSGASGTTATPTAGAGGTTPPAAGGGSGMAAAGSGGAPAAGSNGPAPAACPASSTIRPGDSNQTIMVGDMMRRYIMHIPPGYDGKTPMPLLIDWHPLTQTGSYQRNSSGYAALGDKEGFITLFPDGINNAWNIGPCCTQSRMVDDLGFAKAMVERMRTEACIDTKRVYAAGYSMGGGMSHFLACNAADIFAAVSPAAFDLLEESEEPCKPARPITVHSFRGTADPIVPYGGGASSPPVAYPLDPIHFLGAVGTFKRWAELNQCTGMPEMGSGGCQTYKQCAAGVEVTLCTATGGGHVTGDANIGWATLKRFSLP